MQTLPASKSFDQHKLFQYLKRFSLAMLIVLTFYSVIVLPGKPDDPLFSYKSVRIAVAIGIWQALWVISYRVILLNEANERKTTNALNVVLWFGFSIVGTVLGLLLENLLVGCRGDITCFIGFGLPGMVIVIFNAIVIWLLLLNKGVQGLAHVIVNLILMGINSRVVKFLYESTAQRDRSFQNKDAS